MSGELLCKVSLLVSFECPSLTMIMSSPYHYPQYYMSEARHQSSYSSQPITLHHPHEHAMAHHHMQGPPSPSIPIDPSLALYPPQYYSYAPQQPQPHIPHQQVAIPVSLSSPSSNGSDTIGTPPVENMAYPIPHNLNGKRPASSLASDHTTDSRKKARTDDNGEGPSDSPAKTEEVKAKPTRGSRWVDLSFLTTITLNNILQGLYRLSSS